jgi:hypothetical protein
MDFGSLAPSTNIVGSKWIFKNKQLPHGSIEKHKAHLITRGFIQQKGIDYGDIFSPVCEAMNQLNNGICNPGIVK